MSVGHIKCDSINNHGVSNINVVGRGRCMMDILTSLEIIASLPVEKLHCPVVRCTKS